MKRAETLFLTILCGSWCNFRTPALLLPAVPQITVHTAASASLFSAGGSGRARYRSLQPDSAGAVQQTSRAAAGRPPGYDPEPAVLRAALTGPARSGRQLSQALLRPLSARELRREGGGARSGPLPPAPPELCPFRKARAARRLAAPLGLCWCTGVFGLNRRPVSNPTGGVLRSSRRGRGL